MKQGGWKDIIASLDDVSKHKPPISASRVQNITRLATKHSKVCVNCYLLLDKMLTSSL